MAVRDVWYRKDPTTGKKVPSAKHGRGKRYEIDWRDLGGAHRSESFALKADAQARWGDIQHDLNRGVSLDRSAGKGTVGAFLDGWLKVKAGSVDPATLRGYTNAVKMAKTDVGLIAMADLAHRPSQCQVAANRWQADYAPSTVRVRLAVIREAFDSALLDNIVPKNPWLSVRLKTAPAAERDNLQPIQIATMLAGVDADDRALIETFAGTGVRLGELLGLHIGDVEFLTRQLQVRRKVDTSKAERVEGPDGVLKHNTPARTVVLDDDLLDTLAAYIERHHGTGADPSTPLFVADPKSTSKHPYMTRGMVDAVFGRIARVTGVETHPHALRHYYGSTLLAGGEDLATTAKAMGHTVQELIRTYTYMINKEGGTVSRAAIAAARAKVVALMPPEANVGRMSDGADSEAEVRTETP